jgi:two-component system alkaline phosphatase synthesis response regulator PhoP
MPTPGGADYTVLVVDDSADLRALVAESLRKLAGFTVVTAEDGVDGLERYFEVRPACVVIDVKMPRLDGYQLIRALRGDPESSATPLVILSAMVQERDRLAGFLSGVDEYLLKPVSPLELVRTIRDVIDRGEAERQRRLRALLDDLDAQGKG